MQQVNGSSALRLDFEEWPAMEVASGRAALRLARPVGPSHGASKYQVLEHRRRQAQIKARHILELEGTPRGVHKAGGE